MKTIFLSAFLVALVFALSAQASIITYHSGYNYYPTGYYSYPSYTYPTTRFSAYYNSPSFSISAYAGTWNNYWDGYQWATPGYYNYYPSYNYPTAYYQPVYYCTNSCYWVGGYYYCGC